VHLLTRTQPELTAVGKLAIETGKLGVSPSTRRFLSKLLAAKPADRFESAAHALEALRSPRTNRGLWAVCAAAGLVLSVDAVVFFTTQGSRPVAISPPVVAPRLPVVVPERRVREPERRPRSATLELRVEPFANRIRIDGQFVQGLGSWYSIPVAPGPHVVDAYHDKLGWLHTRLVVPPDEVVTVRLKF
jgi:hypothetical protein